MKEYERQKQKNEVLNRHKKQVILHIVAILYSTINLLAVGKVGYRDSTTAFRSSYCGQTF